MARPTKRTPEARGRILGALRTGNYRSTAARLAGMAPSVLFAWLADDSEFSEACKQAEAECACAVVASLTADKDSRSRQFWLSRKMPKEWGQQREVARVELNATVPTDPETLRRMAAEMVEMAKWKEGSGD